MTTKPFAHHPYQSYQEYPPEEMRQRAEAFAAEVRRRRTVRFFDSRPVERIVIEQCLWAAGSAPSGANQQPWHFVAVNNPDLKAKIRQAAEAEEYEFYTRRATPQWLATLAPLGTNWQKPFLEIAPWLIAVFAQPYQMLEDKKPIKHYYVTESVGLATGMLITALHHAGLATLTHTPSPMGFLNEVLGRPAFERPFVLLVVGYPAADATVPTITKKPLSEYTTFLE